VAASALQRGEDRVFGRAYLEALVLAILLGTVIRTARPAVGAPASLFARGIRWSGSTVLECAVALLGASLDVALVMQAGAALITAVVVAVTLGLVGGYAIGRAFGLRGRLAVLVACGNAICGNSAIAAVAPVIGADGDEVASSIAFTAVLGVVVVLTLPALITVFHLSHFQYGVLAGLTVYAVPQVLAATFPVSALSGQIGTFVKLVRVLMLGPVVVGLSLRSRGRAGAPRVGLHRLIPWFILAFLALAALRSLNVITPGVGDDMHRAASALATVSMAALGLGVDIRALARTGARVTATVTVSLLALVAVSLALIAVLRIGV
jgi:uncharacterized integral membrane protein (TIGR00698 family)